jgi:hypothetical protein
MVKFLLICPTSALEKIFDPRNTHCMPAVKIFFRLEFEQISEKLEHRIPGLLEKPCGLPCLK